MPKVRCRQTRPSRIADRAGENFRGVGAGIQREGKDGAIQALLEEVGQRRIVPDEFKNHEAPQER